MQKSTSLALGGMGEAKNLTKFDKGGGGVSQKNFEIDVLE